MLYFSQEKVHQKIKTGPATQGDQVNAKEPIKGVVVVTKRVGKYNNSRVMVLSFDFSLSLSKQLSVGVLSWDQITPGTKILKIHEPGSDEITGNLHHLRVNQ